MSATAFLAGRKTNETAPTRAARPAGATLDVLVTLSELTLAIAALEHGKSPSADRATGRRADEATPTAVATIIGLHTAISQREWRREKDCDGRDVNVATGRRLTGLVALKHLATGFGGTQVYRKLTFDTAATDRLIGLADSRLRGSGLAQAWVDTIEQSDRRDVGRRLRDMREPAPLTSSRRLAGERGL